MASNDSEYYADEDDEPRFRAVGSHTQGDARTWRILDRVREAVAVRVEATSVRSVAREVGISVTVVEHLLSGGIPQHRSRQKLEAWWDRVGLKPREALLGAGARDVLRALVAEMAGCDREPAINRLIGTLVTIYEDCGPLPPWLQEIRGPEPHSGAIFIPGERS